LDTLITISQPVQVKGEVETKPDSCGANTGEAFVKMSGGEPPFEWEVEGMPRQTSPYFVSMGAGDYKLNIKDRNSCSTRLAFTIRPYTPPQPIKNIELVPARICRSGGEIKLSFDPSVRVTGILLDNEDVGTRGHLTNVRAGERLVQIKVGSCVFDTLITVPVLPGTPPVIRFSNKNEGCSGGGGSSTVLVSNITSPFTVSFNGGSFGSEVQFNNLSAGIYLVVVKDSSGCVWPASDTILPYVPASPPVIDSAVNENRCLGIGNIRLAITGTEAPYRFQVDGSRYNSGMRSVDLTPGTYPVIIYNTTRCAVDTLQFTIRGKGDCDTIRAIYIPSAFTPNGDGKNDILYPLVNPLGKVMHFVFRVYNRSGQVVFESRAPGKGWDGKLKGIQQPGSVYVWVFNGTDSDGKPVNFKGTTLLLR
jgi:gliding motility-associated-like protein